MNRFTRLLITALIIAVFVVGFVFIPFITLGIVILLYILFVFTYIPFIIIAGVYRRITKSRYVCITHPFKKAFITVCDSGVNKCEPSERITKHENDHIKFFSERNVFLQSTIYVIYMIWYGYKDNPIEVRARLAEVQ